MTTIQSLFDIILYFVKLKAKIYIFWSFGVYDNLTGEDYPDRFAK
jgi:hypothetical protein